MKLKTLTLFASLLALQGCIKSEAPNAEADIVACEIDDNLLIRPPVIENNEVKLYVSDVDVLRELAPRFTLSDGATMVPASGTPRNFSSPQEYVVTSESGQWHKTYKVSFVPIASKYSFEGMRYYENSGRQLFHILYEPTAGGNEMTWGSGNAGFMFANSEAPATDYPTCQTTDGYIGKAAKLVTRSTGALGKMFGSPIAAGNLFTGSFEIDVFNPAKSTHFGVPYTQIPTALVGVYKYQAGATVTDKDSKEVSGKKDQCDIYAVLYEVTDKVPYLDGTNVKTHPNIVLIAQLPDGSDKAEWTHFSIPFQAVEGHTVDAAKLKAGKYNLALVMTSSKEGATFTGAVGSTLYVDEVQVLYE